MKTYKSHTISLPLSSLVSPHDKLDTIHLTHTVEAHSLYTAWYLPDFMRKKEKGGKKAHKHLQLMPLAIKRFPVLHMTGGRSRIQPKRILNPNYVIHATCNRVDEENREGSPALPPRPITKASEDQHTHTHTRITSLRMGRRGAQKQPQPL